MSFFSYKNKQINKIDYFNLNQRASLKYAKKYDLKFCSKQKNLFFTVT